MLLPNYLDSLPDSVVALFRQVEEDILEDMARRIVKTESITDTAQWQAWRLEQLGETRQTIRYHLQRLTGKTQGELNALFQAAGGQALYYDDQIYRAAGLTPGKVNDSPALLNLLRAGARQTQKTFQKRAISESYTATQQFERALDRAWLQISSGAFDYQTAIRRAIKDLALAGLQSITYPTGHTDALDVAVRRAVLTGSIRRRRGSPRPGPKRWAATWWRPPHTQGPGRSMCAGRARCSAGRARAGNIRILCAPPATAPGRGCAAGTAGTAFSPTLRGCRRAPIPAPSSGVRGKDR